MSISILSEKRGVDIKWSTKIRLWMQICLHRSIGVIQDIDPMLQVLLICLIMNLQDGVAALDKQTLLVMGMIGMIVFEELI